MNLQIDNSRKARPYSWMEYFGRTMWVLGAILFRLSPRTSFSWRAWLLRRFGATVGRGVHIYPSARIMIPWNLFIGDQSSIGDHVLVYNLGQISIGSRTTVSHYAHLCAGTHDYLDPTLPLLRLPITIGDDAWVCAQSFVGPNVVIGNGAVIGAAAVVTKDVCAWTVVAGNPARPIKRREMRPNGGA